MEMGLLQPHAYALFLHLYYKKATELIPPEVISKVDKQTDVHALSTTFMPEN